VIQMTTSTFDKVSEAASELVPYNSDVTGVLLGTDVFEEMLTKLPCGMQSTEDISCILGIKVHVTSVLGTIMYIRR